MVSRLGICVSLIVDQLLIDVLVPDGLVILHLVHLVIEIRDLPLGL